jgi:two-component system NtrC family sensor kinase
MLPLEYLPACLKVLQTAIGGKEAPPIEIELVTKEKQRRPLELLFRPVGWQGKIVEIVGVARDITARKQAENDSREFRDHAQELADAPTPERTATNEEQVRMLAQMEALHRTSLDITRRLDLPQVLGSIMNTAQELVQNSNKAVIHLLDPDSLALVPTFPHDLESHPFVEIRMSAKDGIAGLVSQEKRPIYVPDTRQDPRYLDLGSGLRSLLVAPLLIGEKVIGTLSVSSTQVHAFRDEDERLLAMLANQAAIAIENARLYDQLSKSEQRYRTYVENVVEAIWEIDAEGRFTYCSPQIERLVGYSSDELLGRDMCELLAHPDDAHKFRKELRQIVTQKGEQSTLVQQARRRDGSWLDMEISCKPVWSDVGEVISYRGVARCACGPHESGCGL